MRRAERQREVEQRRAAAERRQAKQVRRRSALATVTPRWQRTRWRRQQGLLARRRRIENGVILCLVLASQVSVWLLTPDWWLRSAAALLALIATPVLVTLALDRRS
jgi:hypothetical protein